MKVAFAVKHERTATLAYEKVDVLTCGPRRFFEMGSPTWTW
ncbi:unnamed protein product [Amoebophrya sp. A25]|nr:unnamed protein product [Amoebophrya sp. A25]|eukprot:GSA25T00025712001.1